MTAIPILILSDGRPGHYHLSEGIGAAITRRRPTVIQRIDVRRRKWMPARVQAGLLRAGLAPGLVLRLAYGLKGRDLPQARAVISAGGDTLGATVAAGRVLGAESIYCGTLRHFSPSDLSLVVSSYERHRALSRHLVALKPNGIDPDTLPSRLAGLASPRGAPPQMAGLLIGGQSGLFSYQRAEWDRLVAFIEASHAAHGTRWIVSTSRRSPGFVGDMVQALAGRSPAVARFIDFRTAGPGTLPELFGSVEALVVTEDSNTADVGGVCAPSRRRGRAR
ncbi:MAG: ELM1/GtrOC1 family putative glycosyltransferase [Hyphomicrobiaceae bacterium]